MTDIQVSLNLKPGTVMPQAIPNALGQGVGVGAVLQHPGVMVGFCIPWAWHGS